MKKTQNSLKQPTRINGSIKIKEITAELEEDKNYQCSCCGKIYKRQKDNFAPSRSPLFNGNNGYVTMCKNCTDKYFAQLTEFFSGNEEKAIERICSIFDWFYDEDAVASSRRISANRSRISAYPSKLNLSQSANRGTTYLDYIKIIGTQAIDSLEKLDDVRQNDGATISDKSVRKWGLGFTPDEYDFLSSHYKTLKDQAPSDDIITENLIRDLCAIKVQQNRAIVNNEVDKYSKLTELYQKTLGSANLKPKSIKEANSTNQADTYGLWLKDIEKYSPADFFKDKSIYKDYDGLGEYFQRFIVRPFRNLITGSKEMDSEFSVGRSSETGDDEDGGS